MRHAGFSCNNTGRRANDLYIQFQMRKMLPYMLQTSDSYKRSICGRKYHITCHGKSGCNTDHILLGNTDIDKLVGISSLESVHA